MRACPCAWRETGHLRGRCDPTRSGDLRAGRLVSIRPFPWYRRFRETAPAVWVPEFRAWFVTRFDLCQQVLKDERLVVGYPGSSVYDVLGTHMMSTDGDPARRAAGRLAAHAFWTHVREHIKRIRREPQPGTLLDDLVHHSEHDLSDDEICHNAGIIMFGGISTVEALVLDAMWALHTTPGALRAVLADRSLVTRAVHETIRWQPGADRSPTRHRGVRTRRCHHSRRRRAERCPGSGESRPGQVRRARHLPTRRRAIARTVRQ